MSPNLINVYASVDVTKPYKSIGLGMSPNPMHLYGLGPWMSPNPYQFIGFGAMDDTRPYKFIRFCVMDVTKPYEVYMLWWMSPTPMNL
jgi:hypothetical protein